MTTDPKDAEIARLREELEKLRSDESYDTYRVRSLRERAEKAEAERDTALAQVAQLHHLIREASDPDFLWGAMDNVNDMDADITEFANAASRAIQASIPDPDALSRRDAKIRAEGMRMAAETLTRWLGYARIGNSDYVRGQEEAVIFNRDAILAAAEKEATNG